jgi:hypothetical protein
MKRHMLSACMENESDSVSNSMSNRSTSDLERLFDLKA